MKVHELIKQLQKIVEEHPEFSDFSVSVGWEGNNGKGLNRNLQTCRFRLTNGSLPEVVLETR
jgi:hypothetical protein